MTQDRFSSDKFLELRRQAEKLLAGKGKAGLVLDDDPLKLINELQTLQVELELQNEELRISQTALMGSQAKYQELYDLAPVGYLTLSKKGLIKHANLTFSDMALIERRYLVNEPLTKYIMNEDQDILYQHLNDLSGSTNRQVCELRLKRKNKTSLDVALESTALYKESGDLEHYFIIVIDITERKKAESELRQFEGIVESSFDMIALIDANFIYLAANDAYLKAFGKNKDEVIGSSVPEILGGTLFKKTVKPNAEKCMTGKNVRFRKWVDFSVLGNRYVDIQYSPYLEPNGQINAFVVNIRDNTEVQKVKTALEINRRQLEVVFDNIDAAIYTTNMETKEILFMNRAMKEYYKKDFVGAICWKSFHENKTGPCEFCTNDKLIDADGNPTETYVWEFYNDRLNKWYKLHDLAIPWTDGNLVRMEIATDITEQKSIERIVAEQKMRLEDRIAKRTIELEDLNAALRVLLKKRDKDKTEIGEKIFINYRLLLSPIIDRLKISLKQEQQRELIDILDSELKNIISPFSKKLTDKLINLTPMEIQVADLIKHGKSNKEIAQILNSSVHTINRHREKIRKKTGLKNKKINLKSFLLTLD